MTRRQRMIKAIVQYGSVATALVAIAGAWVTFGGDVPAWSSDIQRLNAKQADHAIDFYGKAIRDDTILRSQIQEPVTRALIDQRLQEAQDKLKNARDRKIQLSK